MTGYEKRVATLSMSAHALAHFYEQVFPAILLLIGAEYGLGLSGAGKLGNIFPFFFGLGAIPAGIVVDRFGSRRTMLIYLFVTSLAGVGMLFMRPLWGVRVLLLAMGLSAGLYHPAGLVLIAKSMKRVGIGMGLQGVGGSLGLALGPILAATVARLMGWRWSYAALALPGLALAMWFYLDRQMGQAAPADTPADDGAENRKNTSPKPINRSELSPNWLALFMLLILQILNGFCYRGLLTFMPVYFGSLFQGAPSRSDLLAGGGLTTMVLMVGVAGQYFGGLAGDRFRGGVTYAVSFTAAAPMLLLLGWLSGWSVVLSAGGFALLYFANQPLGNKLLSEIIPEQFTGRAYGIFNFANFGIGSFSASACGWIGQHYGLKAIFPFLGVVLLLASLIAWGMVAAIGKFLKER